VDTTEELTHISLCAGYGGIDIGLKRAIGNVRTIAFSEIEAYATANLVAKMEAGWLDTAPVWTNLKTFPWKDFYGKVDILSGGFPCQPFSSAGRRSGDEDPRHLFPYILDGLKRMGRPPLVFLENVEGIISSKLKGDGWSDPPDTPVLLHVLRELERLGYNATAGVFSAREVGAPHQRKRVFIVGCRADLSESGRAIISGFLNNGRDRPALEDARDRRIRKRDSNVDENGRALDRRGESLSRRRDGQTNNSWVTDSAYPAPRGQDQHAWEPPRVTREAESAMGGDLDGCSGWVDYAELSRSMDNRTDELRMLGNGVVPDTAKRAFRVLWGQLTNEQ